MIIDKVRPYRTEEEQKRIEEIRAEQDKLYSSMGRVYDIKKWYALEDEVDKIAREVEARYIKSHSKKGILADVEEIVNAIEKKDFTNHLSARISQIATLKEKGAKEETLAPFRELTTENYINCYDYILIFLRVQLNALADDEDGTEKALNIVGKRVARWYVKPQPAYIPMAHGRATDAFAFMSPKDMEVDRITGNANIDKFGVQLAIMKLEELNTMLSINTRKLLLFAIATFTQQNDFRHTKTQLPRREVSIPLKEYAQLLGYDIKEHETGTPEEAEREKKRAKNELDNARKKIKKDLDLIHASTLTWEEPVKGKVKDYSRISLVTFTGIHNGEIKIAFSPEIAGYLAEKNVITQFPVKLLGLDARDPTPFYIGLKLIMHYNMDNNQIRGTNDRISIAKLLEVANLQSYEEVQAKDRGHWAERIKDPLEKALDTLTQEGILKDWKYTHAKGIPLTEEEAYNITNYKDFEKLYLLFIPAEKVDHTERIEAKQEARAEAKRKKSTTKKKT